MPSLLFPTWMRPFAKAEWHRQAFALAVLYPFSWADYLRVRRDFDDLESFVCFIGYPRSGHTLIGSLLDAHPQALIGMELRVEKYISWGFSRSQIFALIRRRNRWFAGKNWQWNTYDYVVPGASQGQYGDLKVIGDKKGGGFTWWVGEDIDNVRRLRDLVKMPIKLIHNIRNPLDNIATIAVQDGRSVTDAITRYRVMAEIVDSVIPTLAEDEIFHQWHEDFVGDVAEQMRALCGFVGLPADADYLQACQAVVFDTPRLTRDTVDWSADDLEKVEELFRDIGFLNRYAGSTTTVTPA